MLKAVKILFLTLLLGNNAQKALIIKNDSDDRSEGLNQTDSNSLKPLSRRTLLQKSLKKFALQKLPFFIGLFISLAIIYKCNNRRSRNRRSEIYSLRPSDDIFIGAANNGYHRIIVGRNIGDRVIRVTTAELEEAEAIGFLTRRMVFNGIFVVHTATVSRPTVDQAVQYFESKTPNRDALKEHDCAICTCPLAEGEELAMPFKCDPKHALHKACYEEFLKNGQAFRCCTCRNEEAVNTR